MSSANKEVIRQLEDALNRHDLWVSLSRIWPGWGTALVIVRPETVVRFDHRYAWTEAA